PGFVNYVGDEAGSEEATLTFYVSDQLAAFADTDTFTLMGACVLDGFGGLDEACLLDAPPSTVGRISFEARVLNTYRDPPEGGSAHIVQNDVLNNEATISGDIVNVFTGVTTDFVDSDSGDANVTVGGSSTSKSIVFIGDDPPTGDLPQVSSGDLVTFQ